MSRLTGDDPGNVVPLRPGRQRPREAAGASVPDVAEAVRCFDLLERHALRLESGVRPTWGDDYFPIVSYMVQLPLAERQLEELGRLTIMNCPDTGWVLELAGARAEAVARLRAVDRSLLRDLPGIGRLGERPAEDVRRLTSALRRVRQLLVRQRPEAASAP